MNLSVSSVSLCGTKTITLQLHGENTEKTQSCTEKIQAPPQPSPKGREHLPFGQFGMRQCQMYRHFKRSMFPSFGGVRGGLSFGGVRGGLNLGNLINLNKILVQTKSSDKREINLHTEENKITYGEKIIYIRKKINLHTEEKLVYKVKRFNS